VGCPTLKLNLPFIPGEKRKEKHIGGTSWLELLWKFQTKVKVKKKKQKVRKGEEPVKILRGNQ